MLIDVNTTGLVQPHELRRVLETFCLKMKDEEYKKYVSKGTLGHCSVEAPTSFKMGLVRFIGSRQRLPSRLLCLDCFFFLK